MAYRSLRLRSRNLLLNSRCRSLPCGLTPSQQTTLPTDEHHLTVAQKHRKSIRTPSRVPASRNGCWCRSRREGTWRTEQLLRESWLVRLSGRRRRS